jgi:hypothetical protein
MDDTDICLCGHTRSAHDGYVEVCMECADVSVEWFFHGFNNLGDNELKTWEFPPRD